MKVALLLNEKKKESNKKQEALSAVVFSMEDGKVSGVENEALDSKEPNYLSLWALGKKIKEIYIPDVDEQVKYLFDKLGIRISKYDELSEDSLFQTFIL